MMLVAAMEKGIHPFLGVYMLNFRGVSVISLPSGRLSSSQPCQFTNKYNFSMGGLTEFRFDSFWSDQSPTKKDHQQKQA